MNTIMVNKCIIGDTYEQCLQDYITYLQNNKDEKIFALVRTSKKDIHAIFHAISLKHSPFTGQILHLNTLFITDKIIMDEKDEITQKDIENWCKPYDLPDDDFKEKSVERYIYTIHKKGALSKYAIYDRCPMIELNTGNTIKDKATLVVKMSTIY